MIRLCDNLDCWNLVELAPFYIRRSKQHFCSTKCHGERLSEINRGENHPFYGKHHSEKSKHNISNSRTGKCVGEGHPMFGKHHKPKSIALISEHRKGKSCGEDNPSKREDVIQKISEANSGKKNGMYGRCDILSSNWRGGLTPENARIRHSFEMKQWRESVFKRDNYSCIKCDQYGGTLRAHHQYGFHNRKNLRSIVSNGITLCKDCHEEFHSIFGKLNNSPIQVMKFLLVVEATK
jgi:hypothetical protein